MFALNIADGSQAMAPVLVQGPDTSIWKQRSSLTFVPTLGPSGTIFFAHGSVFESGGGWNGYTGGIVAFDVAGNAVVATLPMTAGIWMAGQGLIADEDGYLYAITGNGDFDPSKGFYGESFVKVQYTPAAGASPATLKVIDQWSPWTDYQRAGQRAPATKVAGSSMPSETVKPVGGNMSMPLQNARITASLNERGQVVSLVYPMAKGAWADEDWGSAGPACIFALNVCVATGKDGIAYPIDSRHLGQTTAASVGTATNYAKLKAPCAWLTMSPGNVPCDPADARQLNFFPNGLTAHLHMTPVQLYEPLLKSWVLFAWGENSALHKWAVGTQESLPTSPRARNSQVSTHAGELQAGCQVDSVQDRATAPMQTPCCSSALYPMGTATPRSQAADSSSTIRSILRRTAASRCCGIRSAGASHISTTSSSRRSSGTAASICQTITAASTSTVFRNCF